MVNIKKINPGTPVAGPYSPGIKVGNTIYISGQGPAPGTKDITQQTKTTLENIKKIIEAAGGTISDIVKTTVFLKNIQDFRKMNKAYESFFNENGVSETFPARTTIEISNLPLATMLIEIDAIAVI